MSKNEKVLASFVAYCKANPSQRFWQALRNWAYGIPKQHVVNFVFISRDGNEMIDTFYWEGRNGNEA